MKALMVMYDSLRRDLLSVYGGPIPASNFERLAAHTVCFDKSYVGSPVSYTHLTLPTTPYV